MLNVEGGGKHFYNSVGFVSGAIDGLLYLVPTIAAVSKGIKFGNGFITQDVRVDKEEFLSK